MNRFTLRVRTVRSQDPLGFGGCIFFADVVNDAGSVRDAKEQVVVKASATTLGNTFVEPGQWWSVSGPSVSRVVNVNGYAISELQVDADSAALVRPSGEHLITFLADNPAFTGIGTVKARRLWERHGKHLYTILDKADVSALTAEGLLGQGVASTLIEAWARLGDAETLQWLQQQQFDVRLGRKVLKFFGRDAIRKIEEDPYRLLSFHGSWKAVDQLALRRFGLAHDDSRRILGAVEEACYRVFSAGHTSVSRSTLMAYVRSVLASGAPQHTSGGLVVSALETGRTNGSFIASQHGVQPLGAAVMERMVARALHSRIVEPLLESDVSRIDDLLRAYEEREQITLNPEQRDAVYMAACRKFAVITGGAGVGKTTVLKALYTVFDASKLTVVQLALAGRAAKRMQEATGRPALTIASFLRGRRVEADDTVVVVDEASMLDIITMSRLCEWLGDHPRLILVGDTAQLMPVGPGLVLHALANVDEVPVVHLKTAKRYGAKIAEAAKAIREGIWPAVSASTDEPIAFVRTDQGAELPEAVFRLYAARPGDTQILCARKSGMDGTLSLNTLCQSRISSEAPPVRVWSKQHHAYALTGLRLGDPVLCTRNLWDRGIQNGSLGRVVQVEEEPRLVSFKDEGPPEHALAWIEWDDGIRRPLVEQILDDVVLGYAITVHKAQGSQWNRVLVPLTGHRLLDRTLVYTAVTRAQSQVIMIGDEPAVKAAVQAPPKAASRQVALDTTLLALLRVQQE